MPGKIFKALSEPTRISILKAIGNKEICSCKIPEKVNKAQPTVSQHLKILEQAGILKARRDGRMILYSVKNKRVFDIIRIAGEFE